MARQFPSGPQIEFLQQPGPFYQGLNYRHDPVRDHFLSAFLPTPTEVSQVTTLTVTWGADADVIGFTFDGVTIPAAALTDDDTSAAALNDAINTYITANPDGVLASSTVLTNVVTVTYSDALPHTDAGFDSGTSTVVAALGTAAVSYPRLEYGWGTTIDTSGAFDLTGVDLRAVQGAVNGDSTLLCVLALSHGGENSRYAVEALGYDPDYLLPGKAYRGVKKGGVVVPWVGTLPTGPTDQVFWINDPAAEADRNKFRSDANGGEADLVSAFVEGIVPDLSLAMVYFDL